MGDVSLIAAQTVQRLHFGPTGSCRPSPSSGHRRGADARLDGRRSGPQDAADRLRNLLVEVAPEYWVKGETSGHVQQVREVRIDCDGDAVLLMVDQTGPACHTGLRSCFDTASVRP